MTRVCYFTSKPVSDARIFEKVSTTLVNAGYEVYIVTPNVKNEIKILNTLRNEIENIENYNELKQVINNFENLCIVA